VVKKNCERPSCKLKMIFCTAGYSTRKWEFCTQSWRNSACQYWKPNIQHPFDVHVCVGLCAYWARKRLQIAQATHILIFLLLNSNQITVVSFKLIVLTHSLPGIFWQKLHLILCSTCVQVQPRVNLQNSPDSDFNCVKFFSQPCMTLKKSLHAILMKKS
jgi:hypothetical protein